MAGALDRCTVTDDRGCRCVHNGPHTSRHRYFETEQARDIQRLFERLIGPCVRGLASNARP